MPRYPHGFSCHRLIARAIRSLRFARDKRQCLLGAFSFPFELRSMPGDTVPRSSVTVDGFMMRFSYYVFIFHPSVVLPGVHLSCQWAADIGKSQSFCVER